MFYQIIPARVYILINICVGMVAILWAFIIYGMNKGNYPQCTQEHLEKWYLIYAVTAIAYYPLMLLVMMLAQMLAGARDDSKPALIGIIYCSICFISIMVFFIIAWWIAGNVWIWNSSDNEYSCGALTSWGKKLLIYQYASMGFLLILGCMKEPETPEVVIGPTEPVAAPPPPPPPPPPEIVPVVCPTCFKMIQDRDNMKAHLRVKTCVAPRQRGILGLELGTSSLTVGLVREGGPAAVAGITEGDTIVTIRGVPMTSNEEVLKVMGSVYVGDVIPVEIRHSGMANATLVRLLINKPITDLESTRNKVLRSLTADVQQVDELQALLVDEPKFRVMVRTCFDLVDTDKNGKLSRAEFRDLVYKVSIAAGGATAAIPPTSEEVDIIFNDIDADGSGEISFEEFQPQIRKLLTDALEKMKQGEATSPRKKMVIPRPSN